MRKLIEQTKKLFTRRLTFMIVPHSVARPFQFNFTISFALFGILLWTGLTSWATWAVISNVDYWTMRVDHELLKVKVGYFVKELRKSRELVDSVRQADIQIRQLLNMKDRKAILEARPEEGGQGGAEPYEQSVLQKELSQKVWEITSDEIRNLTNSLKKEADAQVLSYKEISEYIAYERNLYRSVPYGWPVAGRITSQFGQRVSPMHGGPQFHMGVDIANEEGVPISVTGDGVVRFASWEGGYGKLVVVDHGFGYMTYYAHCSLILVGEGQKVKRGQIIAYMGSTGSSTGSHVHYEVQCNGGSVNPWRYMTANSVENLRIAWDKPGIQ